MEFLAVIAMICAGSSDKGACESKMKDCAVWVTEQPAGKQKDLNQLDAAVFLAAIKDADRAKLCK